MSVKKKNRGKKPKTAKKAKLKVNINNINVMKKRALWILGFFSFLVILLGGRLFWLQVVKGDGLRQAAYEQQNAHRFISPAGGHLRPKRKELAVSVSVKPSRRVHNRTIEFRVFGIHCFQVARYWI